MAAISSGGGHAHPPGPDAGRVISTLISYITLPVLAVCISRRLQPVKYWRQVSVARWLLIIVYIDSFVFVFLTGFLERGFGIDRFLHICSGAQVLCLISYVSTKFLYLFLVEKAYIVRGKDKPRLKDKLYIINFFGMLIPYGVAFTLSIVFRFHHIGPDGLCYVGIERLALAPTIITEIVTNVYLTALFIFPIRKLYSYRNRNTINSPIRTAAVRTFIGSCATLVASALNLSFLIFLEAEPGWMCLMLCTLDLLFMVLVLHWVTTVDIRRQKLPSRFDPANSRSVFRYGKGPVVDGTSNTYTLGLGSPNGDISGGDNISKPSAVYCADGFGNGNNTMKRFVRPHSQATEDDIERQDITVSTIKHDAHSQIESDRRSTCSTGTGHVNGKVDERIASTDGIVQIYA